jgi:hypothetical protein
VEVQVSEREAGIEAVMVLSESAVAHRGEPEDALQDAEGCPTFARTLDLLLFFARCNWSTRFLYRVRLQVMS